jgi:hypothetical protein
VNKNGHPSQEEPCYPEAQEHLRSIANDPFYFKILKMVNEEARRNLTLSQEYQQINSQYKQLLSEGKSLSEQYQQKTPPPRDTGSF